jgi:hypothetical protein
LMGAEDEAVIETMPKFDATYPIEDIIAAA